MGLYANGPCAATCRIGPNEPWTRLPGFWLAFEVQFRVSQRLEAAVTGRWARSCSWRWVCSFLRSLLFFPFLFSSLLFSSNSSSNSSSSGTTTEPQNNGYVSCSAKKSVLARMHSAYARHAAYISRLYSFSFLQQFLSRIEDRMVYCSKSGDF